MKAIIIASAILCTTSIIPSTSFAADPCEVVLCMYGKVAGSSGGDSCKSAENAFFDIVKKKHGSFLPDHTADARRDFLGECTKAPTEIISQIINVFGRINI